MTTERKDARGGDEHTTERYTGPSARQIADLLDHPVAFERGWFWTSAQICHGGDSRELAFRQRADGEGIDVRCHAGACSPGVAVTRLEAAAGRPIWSAYEAAGERPKAAAAPRRGRRRWPLRRIALTGGVALAVAMPLALGLGAETTFVNFIGVGFLMSFALRMAAWSVVRRLLR